MMKVIIDKPLLKKVKRVIEYIIESYAEVEGFDKAIGLTIESNYGRGVRLLLDNYVRAKDVYRYFESIFDSHAKEKTELQLVPSGSFAENKQFLAEWSFIPSDMPKILNDIEKTMGTEWKEAFYKIWSVYHKDLKAM